MLPRDLETIIQKAIEREPAGRYATAGALAEDLRGSWMTSRSAPGTRASLERCWKWAKRRPAIAALLASLALAVLTGLTAVTWQWRSRGRRPRRGRQTLNDGQRGGNTSFKEVSEDYLL